MSQNQDFFESLSSLSPEYNWPWENLEGANAPNNIALRITRTYKPHHHVKVTILQLLKCKVHPAGMFLGVVC